MKSKRSFWGANTKVSMPLATAALTLILFSGAAYAPPLLNPPILPIPGLQLPAPQRIITKPRAQTAVKKTRPSKSKLAQRLNNRYRVSYSLRASA